MKVLQVNCVYQKGSTGKIVSDIDAYLKQQGIDSVICYGRGEKTKDENVWKVCGEFDSGVNHFVTYLTGQMYGGCLLSTRKLERIIEREKPDVVHLHCINGYFVNIYRLIGWLKKHRIKTVLTLHAEFMYTANCSHALDCEKWKTGCGNCPRLRKETGSFLIDGTGSSWKRMKKAFEGFERDLTVVSVSPWLMDRAKQSPILADMKHCVILNGVNTDIFHRCEAEDLRKKYAPNGEKILFQATPYFSAAPEHIKGGYYAMKLAEALKEQPIRIVVAGNYDQSIRYPENMVMLGNVADQKELARLYSMADVTLLTSQKETFSMVTAESLCCGTPVVGFRAGAPEQIALSEWSEFVPFGDVEGLREAVRKWIFRTAEKEKVQNDGMTRYCEAGMENQYLDVYREAKDTDTSYSEGD